MNVGPLIEKALKPMKLPVAANTSLGGEAKEWIAYVYADERPEICGDDTDLYDITTIQVHYFTKKNTSVGKKEIRRRLRDAGFDIQSTYETFEEDTKINHVIITAEIGGVIDD